MAIVCKTCGKVYHDPGGELSKYWCNNCPQKGPLVRFPKKNEGEAGKVIGAGAGATLGAAVGGPVGAVVGALIGWLIGNEEDKK
jgi:uncharacterized protein YcfJ